MILQAITSVLIATAPVLAKGAEAPSVTSYQSIIDHDDVSDEALFKASMTRAAASTEVVSSAPTFSEDTTADNPFGRTALSNQVLAEQRGGIRLPSGIDVVLSVETRTAIDGEVVLQTVVKIDSGAPVTTVYVPETGRTVMVPERALENGIGAATRVTYDRQSGISITRITPTPDVSVKAQPAGQVPQPAEGLREIDISSPVTTDHGLVSNLGQVLRPGVELKASDIQVVHFTGGVFGSGIFNFGHDRAIDTQTTISIDLRNAGPEVLGSAMFRVESIGIDALSIRL